MTRAFVGIAVVFLIVLAIPAGGQVVAVDRGPMGLTVTGMGEVGAAPDVAHVSLGVQTRAREAATAARDNAERTTAVINALRAAGIAERDIQTLRFTILPVYDHRPTPPILLAYEVSNIVRATVRDLNRVGAIIDAAIAAGANNVQSVNFALENDAAVRREALVAAIDDARAKANTMAERLNITLGPVLAVTETSPPVFIPMPQIAFAEARAVETPIMPQEITIRANVQITYSILAG